MPGKTSPPSNFAYHRFHALCLITLPATRCTPPVVEQLKEVLRTHPGSTEVRLRLVTRGATRVMRLDDRLRVSASPALYGDLKHLLGPGCLG